MAGCKERVEDRENTFPSILVPPPRLGPPPPFLQVGRAVFMENDETGQADGVGEEE